MKKMIKVVALGSLLTSSAIFAAGTAGCLGCHGANFEKVAMGKSKVVKDMSKEEIVKALKGYKDGSYGGAMKGLMKGQVVTLDDAAIEAMAAEIKGGGAAAPAAATPAAAGPAKLVDINKDVGTAARLDKEDLGNKKIVTESTLGLRKADLYSEDTVTPNITDYDRPAPGASTKFERAYVNAPPMIPHSVDGLLPITQANNQCIGCHMPETAAAMGATPIPVSHFTNYRPETVLKNGELIKEGHKVGLAKGDMGNVSDIVIAKAKKTDTLYHGRFNCSQCHAPQSKVDTAVGNTFQGDFGEGDDLKSHSSLADAMNEGVK